MNNDRDQLVTGDPAKVIGQFCIPILLSAVLQKIYNMVDTVIIGQFLGTEALAGAGATGSVNFLVLGFCLGIGFGFAIPVAQRFGAKDYPNMRQYITNGIELAAVFSVLFTALVVLNTRRILIMMNTPANILEPAYDYIVIIFMGIPITLYYNIYSGFIRSLGDSKSPFYILLASAVINIGADLLSVTVFHMGIEGPAYATLLAQLFSVIACILVIHRRFPDAIAKKEEWKPDLKKYGYLAAMGVPMGLQYSITAIGSVVLQVGINSLGSDAVAAVTAAQKISLIFSCVTDALGTTMATFAGQNIGARKPERIRAGIRQANKIGIIYSICCAILFCLLGRFSLGFFVSPEETGIIDRGYLWLRINGAFYILLNFVNVFRFTIQGMGYSLLAIIAGILEMLARSLVGVMMVPMLGFTAVCFGNTAAWIFADLFLIPAYLIVMKREEQKVLLL